MFLPLLRMGAGSSFVRRRCMHSARFMHCPGRQKGFWGFWSFSLGFRPGCLPSLPYSRVCVFVAVFLSTETSL